MDVTISRMKDSDWPEVRAIDEEGITTGQATFELSTPSWEQFDTTHFPHCRLLARGKGGVVGWAALSPCLAENATQGWLK